MQEEITVKHEYNYIEDVMNIFVTIRGFAVARVERNKMKVQRKLSLPTKSAPGRSFGEALKESCKNVQ